jgi:uncharacterized membrane protein YphA (DoxX/SURF4 family)
MRTIITIIRAAIGWHFLYEGCVKLFANNWSAASFLNNAQGFLSGFYHWLAASPGRLDVIDFLNVWGLVLIGLALFLGVFIRWASLAGAMLLALYYFAYPPFGTSLLTSNGSVYIVNQLFIEAAILVFFFCYKERGYGLDNTVDHVVRIFKGKKKEPETVSAKASTNAKNRRDMLKNLVVLPVLGLTGWSARQSLNFYSTDATSGATVQVNRVALSELKGKLPKGKLGNHEISRLIMGGNLFDGTAHARDLLYVSSLFKSYNTEKRIYETLILCEQAGINSIAVSDWVVHSKILNRYKKLTGSKMEIINYFLFSEDSEKNNEGLKRAIDLGVDIIQVHGTLGDRMVLNNRLEVIDDLLNLIRRNGVVAGLAAHSVGALIACEQNDIIPDYYMKSMHHDKYWSAHPLENRKAFEMSMPDRLKADHNMWHDNLFDTFPDRTIEFVNHAKVPVIGFKVLAGGAIHPKDGFKYAFENGADFICAGMFDFQVVDDVNICIDTLNNLKNRKRDWYA